MYVMSPENIYEVRISLLSVPGKVYRKIITERVQRLTEEKIGEEQGGFRKGRGCV